MARQAAAGITVAAEIAGFIKCQLLTGRYSVGEKLPTAGELARRFGVDPNTARAAYARLKAEGLVESTRGRGTFVRTDIQQRHSGRLGALVESTIREARSLGLSAEELATVIWLQKRFSANRPRIWYVDNDFPYFEAIRHRIEELAGSDAQGCTLGRLKERIDEGAGTDRTGSGHHFEVQLEEGCRIPARAQARDRADRAAVLARHDPAAVGDGPGRHARCRVCGSDICGHLRKSHRTQRHRGAADSRSLERICRPFRRSFSGADAITISTAGPGPTEDRPGGPARQADRSGSTTS